MKMVREKGQLVLGPWRSVSEGIKGNTNVFGVECPVEQLRNACLRDTTGIIREVFDS